MFLIWPEYQGFGALRLEVNRRENKLRDREQYLLALKNAAAELKKYDDELSKINSALPLDPSLPSLFEFLEKTSSQSGLVLRNISSFATNVSKERPGLTETHVDIGISGSYPSFRNFLTVLEKSARLIEIENISISPMTGRSVIPPVAAEPDFSVSLRIKTHSY